MITKTITILLIAAAFALAGCWESQPNPQQAKQTEQLMQQINAALDKRLPTPTPVPVAAATPLVVPEILNPFETDEQRAERARRKGFILMDGQGSSWGRIARDDNGDVTTGLPPELTTVYTASEIEPMCARQAEGWTVRWQVKKTLATPTPAATITPTATP